eukprot:Gb_27969 [translate_table: standard]
MRISFHSTHEPICGICKKHCRSFDSLREHLVGPLPKVECAKQFSERGCSLCLQILKSHEEVTIHQATCQLEPALPPVLVGCISLVNKRVQAEKEGIYDHLRIQKPIQSEGLSAVSAVSLDCEMVGGGQDGSLDLCGRVCLVDEEENLLFHTYVKPQLPITNYRYETTGIKPEHLIDAMPLKQVQEKIQNILYNGEAIWRARIKGGRAKVLVGHGLDHDFQCLAMEYPSHLVRDTSKYPPLVKTNKASNSLKNLTQAFLGYKIQNGTHDPYEDCVAVMRLYKRMRSQVHLVKECQHAYETQNENSFPLWKQKDLEKMTPEALLEISCSNYYCWCLDARPLPC